MLLSLSHKFLFIANVKTASSSIERALRSKAEIAIGETRFGKHENLSAISRKFAWVRQYVPYSEFFVFGVIREPVDWVLSLYNSHSKSDFDGLPYSTKGVPFDDFLREGVEKRWQMRPQHLRFTDEHGRFRVNHLLDFGPDRGRILLLWLTPLDWGANMNNPGEFKTGALPDEFPEGQIKFIEERFAADYELLQNRPMAF